jgi:hypothetical protein
MVGFDAHICQFGPNVRHAISCIAHGMNPTNLLTQNQIGLRTWAQGSLTPVIKTAGADPQRFTQGAHRKIGLICLHEFEDDVSVFSLFVANQAVAFARMSRSV